MFARANPEGLLFSHLLSSQPARDAKEGAAATALSLAFHAALLAALVLATLTAGRAAQDSFDNTPIVLWPVNPLPALSNPAPPRPGTVPAPGAAFAAPTFAPPTIIPGDYKAPTLGDITSSTAIGIDEANRAGIPGGTGAGGAMGGDAAHPFTVYTVAPELRNRAEVGSALARNYPPLLRDSGIGGTVLVWLLVDEAGAVVRADVKQTSGHAALDQAALKVALTMKFSPAVNRDHNVKVWVALPIVFTAR